jgi:hypothetical protein
MLHVRTACFCHHLYHVTCTHGVFLSSPLSCYMYARRVSVITFIMLHVRTACFCYHLYHVTCTLIVNIWDSQIVYKSLGQQVRVNIWDSQIVYKSRGEQVRVNIWDSQIVYKSLGQQVRQSV